MSAVATQGAARARGSLGRLRAARPPRARGRRRLALDRARARSSAWPASRAAARARSRAPSCRSSSRRPRSRAGASSSAARTSSRMSREELRRVRWRHVSLVFQSAMNVLNPVMRVGDQFVDMFKAHDRVRKSDALARAGDLLELVGHRSRARALVPARALGRHAAARRDRNGACARARADRDGRADDGARRRRAARDPAGARGAQAAPRLRGAVHHARPLAARGVQRPHRDHVRGRDRRVGGLRRALPARAAPVHERV